MAIEDETPLSKALLGAVFIQYIIYGTFYIIEGSRYKEFHSLESTADSEVKAP